MRKLVLSFIFMIGLFAYSCTAPPDIAYRSDQPSEFAQVISVDQASIQSNFIYVANPVVLPSPDTPALISWMTDITKAATLSAKSERSGHKMYSSKYKSNVRAGWIGRILHFG